MIEKIQTSPKTETVQGEIQGREYKIAILASVYAKIPSILDQEFEYERAEAEEYDSERVSFIADLEYGRLEVTFGLITKPPVDTLKVQQLYSFVEKFLDDKGVVMKMVGKYPQSIEFLEGWKLIEDIDVIKKTIESDSSYLEYKGFNDSIRDNEEIVKPAVEKDGLLLRCASKRLQDMESIVNSAVDNNPEALGYVSESYIERHRELVLRAVGKDGRVLRYAPRYKGDKEVVLEALKNIKEEDSEYEIIYDIKETLFSQEDVAQALLKYKASYYKKLPPEMRNKKNIIIATLLGGFDPFSENTLDEFLSDREVALERMVLSPSCIGQLPLNLLADTEFLLDGIERNPKVMEAFVSDSEDKGFNDTQDLDFLIKACMRNPESIRYFPSNIKDEIEKYIDDFQEGKAIRAVSFNPKGEE